MSLTRLTLRSVTYHWRTNLAVVFGVAAAVSVLGGALLVGDSVRGSLRDLVLSRLGRTNDLVASMGFFREALAQDLVARGAASAAPLIATRGFVTHEPSGRRATSVLVYGVDERFWTFNGVEPHDGVFVSPALAAELGVTAGDVLLTRLQKPTDIPLESLFAHKEDIGRTVRLTVTGALPAAQMGEFALQPQQGEVRAVFAPLRRMQRDLGVAGRVNTILVGASESAPAAKSVLRDAVTLDDLSVKVSAVSGGTAVIVESAGGVVNEALEQATLGAARDLGRPLMPVFTYLANTIRVRDRQVPYSLVAGIDLRALPAFESAPGAPPGSDTGQTRVKPGSDPRPTPSDERPGSWRAAASRARCRRDRPQRMDRSGARRTPRRSGHARVLPVGRGRRLAHGEGRLHAGGHRADCWRCRRPPARAGVSRHHAGRKRGRLGSAISAGAVASPSPGRAVLARPSHHTQGLSPLRAGARTVGDTLRQRDRLPVQCGAGRGCRPAGGGAAAEPAEAARARLAGRHHHLGSNPRARRLVWRHRLRGVTSPTSVSSSSCRRCSWWCCSSGSASNSGCARSASFARPGIRSATCDGCSRPKPSPYRSPAA